MVAHRFPPRTPPWRSLVVVIVRAHGIFLARAVENH
jgi:hypothetical protein